MYRQLTPSTQLVAIVPKEETEPTKRNARGRSGKKASTTSVKVPTSIEISDSDEDNFNSKTKKRRNVNTNNIRIEDLPDFARDQTWRKSFLPTLYDKFFASENPFSQFAKGNKEFISLLQAIVKEVYPTVKYEVSAHKSIHALVSSISKYTYNYHGHTKQSSLSQAYNRINEKRSSIGSSASVIIKKHIDTLQGPKVVRSWLLWASRGDGPLFFKEPVPPDAPLKRDDPKYVVSLPDSVFDVPILDSSPI
jgi:hypothetical protein